MSDANGATPAKRTPLYAVLTAVFLGVAGIAGWIAYSKQAHAPAPVAVDANAATSTWLAGAWKMDWTGSQGHYVGSLFFTPKDGKMEAVMEVTRDTDGLFIRERAHVDFAGDQVSVECYKVELPTTEYTPDNFRLTRQGDTLAGFSIDNAGQRGAAVTLNR